MCNDLAQETEQMTSNDDVKTLHSRIDALTIKFEKCNGEVISTLNKIATDVAIIKKTCDTRGKTCATHVDDMDVTLRGNGKDGVLTRLGKLEQRSTGKEKFAYLIIGALAAGSVSLGVAMVMYLVR